MGWPHFGSREPSIILVSSITGMSAVQSSTVVQQAGCPSVGMTKKNGNSSVVDTKVKAEGKCAIFMFVLILSNQKLFR